MQKRLCLGRTVFRQAEHVSTVLVLAFTICLAQTCLQWTFPRQKLQGSWQSLTDGRNLGQPTFCEGDRELFLAAKGSDSWFILAVDTESGRVRKVGRFPQEICHLQGSPRGSTLMFCDQRGDWCVPQRIWLVEADGSSLRPLYQQRPEDWVTHESWTADGRAVSFILHPIGFCTIDKDNTNLRLYTPAEESVETLIPEEVKQLRRLAVENDYPRPGRAQDTYGVSEAYGKCFLASSLACFHQPHRILGCGRYPPGGDCPHQSGVWPNDSDCRKTAGRRKISSPSSFFARRQTCILGALRQPGHLCCLGRCLRAGWQLEGILENS